MQTAADASRTAKTLRRTAPPDRRKFRRVAWSARVRGLTSAGAEFAATTADVGAGGLRLVLAEALNPGEPLVLYIDDVGRVEGVVARVLPEGYAVEFRAPARKRDKIADQLTWIINREKLGLTDEREAERRSARGETLASFGGGVVACTIIDVSVFGVALRTSAARPLIGERVTLGERTGVCVRYIDGGFAVDFRTSAAN